MTPSTQRHSSSPYLDDVDTTAAQLEAGEPQPCGDAGNTVWYRFDTFERGGDVVSVVASSAEFTPVIAAYTVEFAVPSPDRLPTLTSIGCVSDPAQDFPALTFTAAPNTSYYVQVGGAGGTGGPLSVLISCNGEAGCIFAPMAPPDDSETFPPETGGESTPAPGSGVSPPETGSGGYLPGAR